MDKKHVNPRLTLVGAGPGDPDLISIKGVKAIAAADVILYDALANEELLNYAKKDCIKVFVGKRAGFHHFQQRKINKLIVENALLHGHVVRLKGGDPFVFGRGHEEVEYVVEYGIETTVVPGISSSMSVPALQNIPLTKRGTNESFWVVTGTTRNGAFSKDLHLAAQSSATVIVLMGMKQLEKIAELFCSLRGNDEPFAVIQNGSRPDEKAAFGMASTIIENVKAGGLSSPAIIVIGEVVNDRAVVNRKLAGLKDASQDQDI
ncbi:uroporphyrinogen-III C-methyltransferase [Flammeovirgaceae bacterium SG7u.111]|nr:uroporphyrinogen-III C-methyltransferase [Flammeovirgaceae bacterium SG7u.132]WPO33416.1 uroporphyrinogen-III C-methyltransferase [Flammeovirgaceae bacterium SG7u.111]